MTRCGFLSLDGIKCFQTLVHISPASSAVIQLFQVVPCTNNTHYWYNINPFYAPGRLYIEQCCLEVMFMNRCHSKDCLYLLVLYCKWRVWGDMHLIFVGVTNMANLFLYPAVGSLTMKALSFLIFLLRVNSSHNTALHWKLKLPPKDFGCIVL